MVIIDTSAWVEFFRRDSDAKRKLAVKGLLDEYEGALCGPVEMEFLGGASPHEFKKIQAWFNIIPYLPNDQKIWRKAAKNFSLLRAKGFTIPWNDVLIASISIETASAIYAHDKHFTEMAKHLPLHLYTPGYNGQFNPHF